MKIGRHKPMEEAGFDLTPMIDVVLLLIIFFVLSSQFAQAVRKFIPLPDEVGEASAAMKQESMIVDIDETGQMFMVGAVVDMETLLRSVQSQVRASGGQPEAVDLIVRAHRDLQAASINRVALALAGIGVRNWKLATAGEGATGAGVSK